MSKYLTEVIGTFFLVLTIGLAVLGGSPMAPLVIGSALMVMVYMGGHISGAHYNPAVSLAVLLRRKMSVKDFVIYVVCQLLGSLLAAWTVSLIHGKTFAVAPGPGYSTLAILLAEILFTFALALVVLNVATDPATEGNSFYGLAIGFTVAAGAFSVGAISGGAFNPAVGIGPNIVHALADGTSIARVWVYIVGPCLGAVLAVLAYNIQHPEE